VADDVEVRIEALLLGEATGDAAAGATVAGDAVGTITDGSPRATAAYEDLVLGALEGRTLEGLRVVLDCANGAASTVGPDVFRRAGADVTVLHAEPDGRNINAACGSTHPGSLQEAVRAAGHGTVGFAFDGDADRVLAVGEDGALVDGDQLLALNALDLRRRGRLAGDAVVVTVMSNLGFRLAMEAAGVRVVETKVGDRYVLEALADGGYSLGGEQSGHVIFADLATTGDGVLTALLTADLVRRAGRPFAALAAEVMQRLPQVMVNVRVPEPGRGAGAPEVAAAVAEVEAELAGAGRVVLRPSGTEPLVRVMVEAPTAEAATAAADRLAAVVARALGAVAHP
jgi:phosphoglucosamine mutase